MHDPTTYYEELQSDPEGARLLAQEGLILDATERIVELMIESGVTRTEMAERLGKSKAYITQLLSGSRNMTLRTLADLFHVLGHQVSLYDQSVPDWLARRESVASSKATVIRLPTVRPNVSFEGVPASTTDADDMVA
jgi:transcriptional regulator with XRE-family HTH domain